MKGFDSSNSKKHTSQSEPRGEAEQQRSSGLEYPLLTYDGGGNDGGMENQSVVEAAKHTDQTQIASKTEPAIKGIPNANNKIQDFEEVIKEIDKDLSDTQPSSNPTIVGIVHEIKGRASEENKHGNTASMREGFEEHLNAQITQAARCQIRRLK